MTIQEYLRVMRDRWLIIVVAVVVGAAAALTIFLVRPPQYTADVSLYVSAQGGNDPQQAFQGAQLSEQRVKSYNELATSDRVLGQTIRRLGLQDTPEGLASSVVASSGVDSVIIVISASDRSPAQAAAIANTVATVTAETVADLERPAAPNGIPQVAVRVVQQANEPLEPSSTGLGVTIGLGLLAGLVVGLGLAFLRSALDTSIKNEENLALAARAPSLGSTSFDPGAQAAPLVVQNEPKSSRAEAFRQIRTNLQFLSVDSQRRVLIFTSSVPDEGKTTTVANLALAIASAGSRVLLIEADLRRPKLSTLLGMDRSVGLTRVLAAQVPMKAAVQPWGGGAFDLLSSGPTPPNPSELLASQQMRALVDEARANYDYVIIDSPPLLPVTDAAAMAPIADGTIILCRYKTTTFQQLEAATNALQAVSARVVGAILTMVPENADVVSTKYRNYYQESVSDSQVRGAQSSVQSITRVTPDNHHRSSEGTRHARGNQAGRPNQRLGPSGRGETS